MEYFVQVIKEKNSKRHRLLFCRKTVTETLLVRIGKHWQLLKLNEDIRNSILAESIIDQQAKPATVDTESQDNPPRLSLSMLLPSFSALTSSESGSASSMADLRYPTEEVTSCTDPSRSAMQQLSLLLSGCRPAGIQSPGGGQSECVD